LPLSLVSSQVITNEQVVIEAGRSGVVDNSTALKFTDIVVEVSESEISRPVEIGLTEGFESLGINVVGNDRADSALQYVKCDILGFEFKYENGDSRGFLRKRMIRREFRAVLKLTFSDARNKSVSEIKDMNISYEDQINPALANLVKSRKISALAPPFPSSGMKKVVEPVIVTAAAGVLIYLFFANR
jgi:hypothetical protein